MDDVLSGETRLEPRPTCINLAGGSHGDSARAHPKDPPARLMRKNGAVCFTRWSGAIHLAGGRKDARTASDQWRPPARRMVCNLASGSRRVSARAHPGDPPTELMLPEGSESRKTRTLQMPRTRWSDGACTSVESKPSQKPVHEVTFQVSVRASKRNARLSC